MRNAEEWRKYKPEKVEQTEMHGMSHQTPLSPMRWVMACKKGHIDDVDWWYWAHGPNTNCAKRHEEDLFLNQSERRRGLKFQLIEAQCGAKRSLEGIMSAATPLSLKCHGRQPWEENWTECAEKSSVVLKGASNVHYPIIRSALDIPTSTDVENTPAESWRTNCINHANFMEAVDAGFNDSGEPEGVTGLYAEIIADNLAITKEQVLGVIREEWEKINQVFGSTDVTLSEEELSYAEYEAFLGIDQNAEVLGEHVSLGGQKMVLTRIS